MAFLTTQHVSIVGMAAAVPAQRVSNQSLNQLGEDERNLLIATIGINERRVAKTITSEELCIQPARKLLDALKWNPSEVELLVFVTQTPSQPIPGSSTMLQKELGLPTSCMCLDINQGCAGYVYGLSLISSLMESGGIQKALLLVGDTITKRLASDDMSTVPIFSDAGSATALVHSTEKSPMFFHTQSDGSGANVIHQQPNGSMTMNGHEVFHFGLKEVAPNMEQMLDFAQQKKEEVDYFIFHQANKLLNEGIRRKLKIPAEKVPYSLSELGNTSCATIPVTMVSQLNEKLCDEELNIVLSGFGVGLSWGSASLKTRKIVCPKLIELEDE